MIFSFGLSRLSSILIIGKHVPCDIIVPMFVAKDFARRRTHILVHICATKRSRTTSFPDTQMNITFDKCLSYRGLL